MTYRDNAEPERRPCKTCKYRCDDDGNTPTLHDRKRIIYIYCNLPEHCTWNTIKGLVPSVCEKYNSDGFCQHWTAIPPQPKPKRRYGRSLVIATAAVLICFVTLIFLIIQ